ncbi:MAG TPA: YcgN family cysteine cluster protein [Xanthobacteraceae bacterium]|nr:YcgN family cysteine cluster protein [Xanthobacteraceae bacterium]
MSEPFWKTKSLAEMTAAEWESLCDGCGRCCLNKLEDEETGKYYYTDVGCRLLDGETCRCRDYPNRLAKVDDCEQLTPDNVAALGWLPLSCAYRLVAEGKDLYWWHPLVSGDPESVHVAGVSVRGRVQGSDDDVSAEQLEDHVVSWPMRLPKRAKEPRK